MSDSINVVQLVALVVGVTAFLATALMYFVVNSVNKRLDKLEQSRPHDERSEYAAGRVADWTAQLGAHLVLAFQSLYVMVSHLAMISDTDKLKTKAYSHAHHDSMRDLNKIQQTLNLFSSNKRWRESALNQLSEDVGDEETLVLLVELRRWENELRPNFDIAIEALGERLAAERSDNHS